MTGTPGPSGAGGWLVMGHSFQDVSLFARFECTGGCDTGLFRAEKTPDGGLRDSMLNSAGGNSVTYFAVTVDADGKIIERSPLLPGGGQMAALRLPRIRTSQRRGPCAPAGAMGQTYGAVLPFTRPDGDLHADAWNVFEFQFDANILRVTQNYSGQSGGVADSDGYGPIAFYVGGSGEVQFKDIAYKDLNIHYRDPETTSPNFRKQTLNDFDDSWGAAAADFTISRWRSGCGFRSVHLLRSRLHKGKGNLSRPGPQTLQPSTRITTGWSLRQTLKETAGPTH